MNCEVVVVGGGIGGLTTAALLAQRGFDVCLLERESQVGGCAASYEKFGYAFELGHGLYSGWQAGEIHDQVFSELPVAPPEVQRCDPAYVVRLPDQSEVTLTSRTTEFEASLRGAFPECAEPAVEFYQQITRLSAALQRALRRDPELLSASKARRVYLFLREGRMAAELLGGAHSTRDRLANTSARFQRFIDVQLQTLANGDSSAVNFLQAAIALAAPGEGLFAIRGGANALAATLAESLRQSGGKLRLNTPVLRLAYDSSGAARGVDLLSGETVTASRAIISNLTVWDTYGKLFGLNRTPAAVRKQLNALRSWGAYLLFLGMDEAAARSFSPEHLMVLKDWQASLPYDPQTSQFFFGLAPAWNPRGPAEKRAVTVHLPTDVDEWFTFHHDESELEARDQSMLERCWTQLHAALPELGSSVEIIDTATPRTFYELTRRKLGMVGNPATTEFWRADPGFLTSLPNVFIVSDTTSPPWGIAGLTRSALSLANHLTSRGKH